MSPLPILVSSIAEIVVLLNCCEIFGTSNNHLDFAGLDSDPGMYQNQRSLP